MYQALYRKWRPKTFDEVTGQEHVTKTLKQQAAQGRLSHAYLFTGTRGTGKTTCAKILAKAANCQHLENGNPCNECDTCKGIDNGSILEVLELDAASNNGVDQVRALRDEAIYSPAYCKKRVYIIDEVHMLSAAAFNALLKILEEPPAHLMFILATTELHKVPATILSRCQRFSFKRLLPAQIQQRLLWIAQQERLGLTVEGAELLSRLAEGSMRDALSLLDQCAGLRDQIDVPFILDVLGLAGNLDTARLMETIGQRDTSKALELLGKLYESGREMGTLLSALSGLARDILILETAPAAAQLLTGGYEKDTLRHLAKLFPPARLLEMITLLQHTTDGFSRSSNRKTAGELCIIRLCDETLSEDLTGILARLEKIERALEQGQTFSQMPQPGPAAEKTITFPESKREDVTRGEEDFPPWEAPPETPKNSSRKISQEQEQEKETNLSPSLADQTKKTSSEDIWSNISGAVRERVLMPAFATLNNTSLVQFFLEDTTLTVVADTPFTKQIISKPEVTEALEDVCSKQWGKSISVHCRLKAELDSPSAERTFSEKEASNGREKKEKQDKLEDLIALCQGMDVQVLD